MSLVQPSEVEFWELFFAQNYIDNPKLQIFGVTSKSIHMQLLISREYEMKMGQRLKIVSKENGEMCAAFRAYRLSEKCLNSLPLWDEGYMKSYLMNQYLE
jgi:hypothetical protein